MKPSVPQKAPPEIVPCGRQLTWYNNVVQHRLCPTPASTSCTLIRRGIRIGVLKLTWCMAHSIGLQPPRYEVAYTVQLTKSHKAKICGKICRNYAGCKSYNPPPPCSSCLTHTLTYTPMLHLERFANQIATESSITSQNLKESTVPNTCPKNMDPQHAVSLASSLPCDSPKVRQGNILAPSLKKK